MNKPILFVLVLFLLVSCRKEKSPADTIAARDMNTAETMFSDVLRVVHDISEGTGELRDYDTGCIDQITFDFESEPMTALVDFGEDDCVGADSKVRKGKLLITYTGRYRDEGTVITVTPDNFRINDYLVQGTKTITNLGLNESQQPHFSISVSGSITAPGNAYSIQWTSQRIRTWTAGSPTPAISDDEYSITGSGNGTNRFGTPFTVNILTPLAIQIGCPWIKSGTVKLVPQGLPVRTIDFGSGQCNAGFSVTVDGETREIQGGD